MNATDNCLSMAHAGAARVIVAVAAILTCHGLADAAALATPNSPAVLPISMDQFVSGPKKLTLVVKSFEPASDGSGDLSVAVVNRRTGIRQQISTYGILPSKPILENDPASHRRFGVDLARAAALISVTEPSCLDLEVSISSHPSEGILPRAVLDLENASSIR
ncbi:hypothetical protein [Mesorhizobium sp.]|uniref:hypothetical protein n=1 Tax=Mesorhizobium sp. TaxID=1871066 RepID=UPI000FE8A755|nr:hypothetical protein [Mesorhizobium sp.]RWO21741.1 MAG: hypothetical protein EOS09_22275 [Mesorhizobium sp.]